MPGIDDREYHKVAPVPDGPRPSIYELREPPVDLGAWLDAALPALRGARVLDAGCGPGMYVPATRQRARELVALDIAHGRLGDVDHPRRVCGDVQALPFPDTSFDVVMAMHMLYHVPDIPLAAAELRRVLRDSGVLYAFTNSERAQHELLDLVTQCGGDAAAFGDARFSNETGGALLATAFADVVLVEDTSTRLVVTDAECIVDEVVRLRYALEPSVERSWDGFVADVRSGAQAVIDREGAFVMSENHGLFTCR
ncbi:MAG TPA: methyltransferase domain-containing protein [Acidimicrobiales bacterium]|nr:methyltransferase domain-containing protein [Acidimicrobiales bacterium]